MLSQPRVRFPLVHRRHCATSRCDPAPGFLFYSQQVGKVSENYEITIVP